MINKIIKIILMKVFSYTMKNIISIVSMKKITSYENPVEFLPNEGND